MGWKRAISLSWDSIATRYSKDSIFVWFIVSLCFFIFKAKIQIAWYFLIIYFGAGLFFSSFFIGFPSAIIGYILSTPALILCDRLEDSNRFLLTKFVFIASKSIITMVILAFQILASYYIVLYFSKIIS